jgi:hypothetical protein
MTDDEVHDPSVRLRNVDDREVGCVSGDGVGDVRPVGADEDDSS